MTKVEKMHKRSGARHRRATPYPLPSFCSRVMEEAHQKKKRQKASDKKDWHDVMCSVCMEYPHNAVLLLCSSYHKGCRPYMCATSSRYSNCLDQYKKAYTKVNPTQSSQSWDGSINDANLSLRLDGVVKNAEASELLCPLCRGQVKGWTVVEPARKYLNSKKRSCTQDECSFVGTYKALRKHVRAEHPRGRPREVDPSLAEKWKKLENDRELNDVMSTISSTMPGSIVMGDYVIEGNFHGFARDRDMDGVVFRLGSNDGRRNNNRPFLELNSWDDDDTDEDEEDEENQNESSVEVHRGRPRTATRAVRLRGLNCPFLDLNSDTDEDEEDEGNQNESGVEVHRGRPRTATRTVRLRGLNRRFLELNTWDDVDTDEDEDEENQNESGVEVHRGRPRTATRTVRLRGLNRHRHIHSHSHSHHHHHHHERHRLSVFPSDSRRERRCRTAFRIRR